MQFLGNRSPETFFSDFWEKEFLHIPKAVDIPENAIDESDLLEMATDEYFETRLIQDDGKIKVQEEALKIKDFSDLKGSWTLMVHNLNLYNEFALSLEKIVEFIPKWLFDDVMCSVSNKDSKVHAHIDNYNVFILQVKGSRRWLIDKNPNKKYQENCELKILENFNPDTEVTIGPGDMIYIPPHIAHEGQSLEDSISISIGFKSIEDKELVESFLLQFMENFETENFYKTNLKIDAKSDPFELDKKVADELFKRVQDSLSDKYKFIKWLNSHMAVPKNKPDDREDKMNKKEFLEFIQEGIFCFDEFIRMSSIKQESNYLVNINEFSFELNEKQYFEMKDLISNKHLEMTGENSSSIYDQLYILYKNNLLITIDDSEE